MFAIPLVSFLVVPLILLGVVCLALSDLLSIFFLDVGLELFSWIWVVLKYLSHFSFAVY